LGSDRNNRLPHTDWSTRPDRSDWLYRIAHAACSGPNRRGSSHGPSANPGTFGSYGHCNSGDQSARGPDRPGRADRFTKALSSIAASVSPPC